MSEEQYGAVDAMRLLCDLARIVRSSPHSITPDSNRLLARELLHVASGTAHDAGLIDMDVREARTCISEWTPVLIGALFSADEGAEILKRVKDQRSRF